MSHQIYAAIAILVLIGAILTFFGSSINNAITNRLLPAQQQQTSAPASR
jgi:hypothetical protein